MHDHACECIRLSHHACRIMYVSLEWPTTTPWIWVFLEHSQSFSCILITYMNMHYEIVWCILIHSHAGRLMYISLEWPNTPPCIWAILSHPQSFSCILIHYGIWVILVHSQSFSCIIIHYGIFMEVCGPSKADMHKTTFMIMHENAWEWLRMSANDSQSGRGVGHSMLIYLKGHAWSCMRMH